MSVRHLVLVFLAFPLRGALAASTLLVPQQFPTIQEAVAAAIDGDTILVKSGVYAEHVTLAGLTDVMLRGQGKVIVDAGGAGVGLQLDLCSGCTIEKIRVQGADTGIQMTTCGGVTLGKCRVEGSLGDDAFSIHGNACVVKDNRIVTSGGHGVAVLGGDGALVSGNTIVGAGGAGIFCDSDVAGLVVSGNTVSKSSDGGIALTCDGFLLVDNVSKGAVDDGFQLVGDGGTVIGNRATGNAEAGIILVGDDHLLSGNTGKGNGTFDLELQGNGNIVDATNVFKTTGP
jgi:nitrous oxidase accessory protein NosD